MSGGLGRRGRLPVLLLASLGALPCSCGYRAVYGGGGPNRVHVKLVRTLVPDVVASEEVASGVREELLREGALEPGEGWPRAEIEVLRASQSSEGIAAHGGVPVARGIDVGIVARAWISRESGAPPERDTGDMRAEELIAVDETAGVARPLSNEFHGADALRAAARNLGRKLARRLMGHPATSEEPDR